MTDFLFLMAKINLAMAGAILIVGLLRHPMRAAFHARIAYGLWLLVPAAMLASLLPPRMATIPASAAGMTIPAALNFAPMRLAAEAAPLSPSQPLFIAWLVGMAAMALMLVWQQRRFHAAERNGAAGPAVTGFLRPRIVIPSGFAAEFSAPEQAAILAHEKAHLAGQDARINAGVALLRCLCWFNPLVHVGAHWLRKDQELACDATAMRHVPRLDYANALLKSQMRTMALPLGCSWPGREHPLTERVALLNRAQPNAARRRTGIVLIALLTLGFGVGAWAAQPAQPQAAKPFVGKVFFAQREGISGPATFMALESIQPDKTRDNPWPGHVALHFPYGMAQADNASNNWADHKITLSGHVLLQIGLDTMHGETLVFDARTAMLTLDGKAMPSGMVKYVPCTKDCKRI